MITRPICTLMIGVLSLLAWGAAYGDIYKYVDKHGHVYYADNPKNARYRLIIRTKKKRPQRVARRSSQGRDFFTALIKSIAHKNRLDPALLHAVIRAESAYDPYAVSSKGAVGLMQLMPDTARRYGVRNRRDARQNLEGGARYLRDLLGLFGSDVRLAVAAYNAGEAAVKKYGNRIPPFPETQRYVKRVMKFYRP